MPKQIILHYAGSYVERPHTITFDSKREYEKFIQEKGYRLKPNVEYGVFTLNSILRTQFQQSSIKIEDVSETDKPDISTVTPPTIDIKYPQCGCTQDKEEDNNQGNNQEGTDTPPKDEESNDTPPVVTPPVDNQEEEEEDVVVIGGDDDTQNSTENTDTDTDVADTTTTGTDTETSTTDETQNENQESGEGFNRVGPVVSFGPEVTGDDGEESQTEKYTR